MKANTKKKTDQLGIHASTAQGKLRKVIMYHLAKKLGEHYCFRCGSEIESIEDFTIDHKEPWLDSENPTKLFYSMDNIAFSHHYCNVSCARQTRPITHPSSTTYRAGCRCNECIELKRKTARNSMRKSRENKNKTNDKRKV